MGKLVRAIAENGSAACWALGLAALLIPRRRG